MQQEVLFEIKNLCKYFPASHKRSVKAVDNISLKIYRGETLSLVGESGCGKTTLGRTVLGIYPKTSGEICYRGNVWEKPSKSQQKEFQKSNLQNVQVRIDKDSEKMWSAFSVLERDGNFYGVLTFDNSMIRYASERFLNIELILEDECGLKIPKSSVVEEQFFVIPHDYITNGGNSSLEGVMVLDSKGTASFQAVDIYDTSDDGEVYLSRDQLKSGTVIVKPDSSDTYTIETKKPLKGVYNINKGYAIFKKVSILCESDEYYIVQEGDSYGLSNYDHIVQNGAGVSSDDVVFQ